MIELQQATRRESFDERERLPVRRGILLWLSLAVGLYISSVALAISQEAELRSEVEPRWVLLSSDRLGELSEIVSWEGELFVLGEWTLLRSRDRGEHWEAQRLPPFRPSRLWLSLGEAPRLLVSDATGRLAGSSDGRSWAVEQEGGYRGIIGAPGVEALYRAQGLTLSRWSRCPERCQQEERWALPQAPRDLWVREGEGGAPAEGYLVGQRGMLLALEGGAWQARELGIEDDLNGVWSDGRGEVFVVGDGGLVLHSRDYGRRWVMEESGTKQDLLDVVGLRGGDVFLVGEEGAVLRRKHERRPVAPAERHLTLTALPPGRRRPSSWRRGHAAERSPRRTSPS